MTCVSIIVSGAASVGVLSGLLLGIFFLVLTALRWSSRFRSIPHENEFLGRIDDTCVIGYDLSSKSSPKSASADSAAKGRSQFFRRNHGEVEKPADRKARDTLSTTIDENRSECEIKANETGILSSESVQVREVIENMVEKLIGGPLDGITVGRLFSHSSYLAIFEKYHGLLCRELVRLGLTLHLSGNRDDSHKDETSNSVEMSLSRLIQRIICEALTLPNIKEIFCCSADDGECRRKSINRNGEPENEVEDKTYEDILATAILNKVIENIQKENKQRNIDQNQGEGKEDFDVEMKNPKIVPFKSEQLSSMVEEQVEEVTSTFDVPHTVKDNEKEVDEEDKYDSTHSPENIPLKTVFISESEQIIKDEYEFNDDDGEGDNSTSEIMSQTNSWEENWLFQRKRPRSTPNAHHPVPVPMLVPNPSEDFRALVGGVDADDLSDMSDCSDSALQDLINESPRFVTKIETPATKINESESSVQRNMKDDDEVGKNSVNLRTLENLNALGADEIGTIEKELQATKEAIFLSGDSVGKNSIKMAKNVSLQETESKMKSFACETVQNEAESSNNPISMENKNSNEADEEKVGEEAKKMENFGKNSSDFVDHFSSKFKFQFEKYDNSKIARDYYVNGNGQKGSPETLSKLALSQETNQVSNHLNDDFLSWNASSNRNYPSSRFSDELANSIESHPSLFEVLRQQTIRNRHFSTVFKTSELPIEERDRNGTSHGSRSDPRRPKNDFVFSYEENSYLESSFEDAVFDPFSPKQMDGLREDSDSEPEDTAPIVPRCEDSPRIFRVMNSRRKRAQANAEERRSRESGYGSDGQNYSSDSLENLTSIPDSLPRPANFLSFPFGWGTPKNPVWTFKDS